MPGMRNNKRKALNQIEKALLQEEVNNLVKSAKLPRCEADVLESANPVSSDSVDNLSLSTNSDCSSEESDSDLSYDESKCDISSETNFSDSFEIQDTLSSNNEDSQSANMKKYAVVTFVEEESCEVIPTIWMVSKNETKWPNTSSRSVIMKLITDCKPPSSNWILVKIKANSFTNSFTKAMRKAVQAVETSHLSSDSSEDTLKQRRKRQKPLRYLTDLSCTQQQSKSARCPAESPDSESESIINIVKDCKIPPMPKKDELDGSTSKQISNAQDIASDQSKEFIPASICNRIFEEFEKLNKKMKDMNQKIDNLTKKVENITRSTDMTPGFEHLPEDIKFPVESLDELDRLNDKLKKNKDFSVILVRYLYNVGSGKNPRSFILSLTKRVLAQDIAIQFSRYGRKGKKSFLNYTETLNVILAAASMKYKDIQREDLAEMFGKSLAGAADWNKRRLRPSDFALSLTFNEENNC